MRKLFLVAALLNLSANSYSAQGTRYNGKFEIPRAINGATDVDLQNTPISLGRLNDTTTAAVIYAGAGRLLGMCVSGGLVGKYALAFDSGVATSIDAAEEADDATAMELLLSPVVMSAGTAAGSTFLLGANVGCWFPKFPVPFTKGLVGVNSLTDIVTQFYYLKD